jgi:glycerol uptake facilitator-like aquaporin
MRRPLVAELLGSALLAATVVGSGIMAQRLTDDEGLQLLANSLATGAALVALILALGPVSGAFNPVVTLVERLLGALTTRAAVLTVLVQVVGCALGVVVANLMFDLPAVDVSRHERTGSHLLISEVVATFGLVLVVFGVVRSGSKHVAYAVGGYITAAYWFTSSTSFANPAITVARTLSDTFAGIAPGSVAAFVGAQVVGGLLALGAVLALYPHPRTVAHDLVEDAS